MQRMWGVKKVFSFMFLALTIAVLLTACGGGGGGSDGGGGDTGGTTPPPSSGGGNATITGTVSGTVIVAFDQNNNKVAEVTATGSPKTFSITIPVGQGYRFYLIENENTANERVYALYQGTTNVFNIASAVTIDLGFVSTATGVAVPTNNPLNASGVTSGGENTTIPPSLLLLFSVTSNPSTGDDMAYGIAIDSTYKYVVGSDSSPGNLQWRIEKRNLSDGALVSGFGTAGVVTSNPSTGEDWAFSIAIDSTYMYVVGYDSSPGVGDEQWRIEKRNLSDGALVSGFGTAGVVTNNPSTGDDGAVKIAIDSTYMYVIGYDSSPGVGDEQWRIEKRLLSTGALDASFGTAGVVTNDPSTGGGDTWDDGPSSIAIDSTYMYVAGWDSSPAIGRQWRIEKRLLSTGALDASFGTAGVVTNDPTTSIGGSGTADDEIYSIAIDSTYMYVVGYDNTSGDQKWRIEKRNLSDGALAAGFGTAGVVTSNPSTGSDGAYSIAIDSTYMYVLGGDNSHGNYQWRIEKRNLSDGALVSGFGTGGVVTNNPSTGEDWAYSIAIDSTYIYAVGGDRSPGNNQWRIEKRRKGSLFGLADLQGTWNMHYLVAGDGPSPRNGWGYGTIVIDGNGNVTFTSSTRSDNDSTLPGPSTISITSSGVVSYAGISSFHGVMSQDKNMFIATMNDSGGGYALIIFQKAGETFAPSDLTGTWNWHQLWSGDGANMNGWIYGTAEIAADGSTTVTCSAIAGIGSSCGAPLSKTLTIDTVSGVVSESGNSDFHGVMSQDKSIIVGKTGSGVYGYDLIILQKAGGTFTQSDLTGTWNFHLLTSGDSPDWLGWGYGSGNIDSNGTLTFTSITRSDGNSSLPPVSPTLSITSSGVVTAPPFHGVMSQDKSMMVATNNDGGGGYQLSIWMK